ncbi:putative transporter svop-1 [Anticarsia gemmatalis]|uniref:putative transporter svop-1 n=1 Tax=Anticarsia gemmatalis TaxID=129554 RepID=UPI003F7723EC
MNMNTKPNRVAFEQALDMTGYSRFNLCMFILASSINISMAFEIFSISYLVPASVCELNTTNIQQGYLACVPLAGIIATSHVWGYLADTKGRRKILIVSTSMGYIASTLAAFSPNWIVLSLLKLVATACVAGAFATSLAFLGECTPVAKRSMLLILSSTVFLSGTAVMAVIAIPVLPLTFSYYIPVLDIYFNSWRLLDMIYALPIAVSAIGANFAYESPKYLVSVGRHEEALEALRGMYVLNTGKSGDSYQVHALVLDEDHRSVHKGFFASIIAQSVPMLKPPLLKDTILLSCLCCLTYMGMNSFMIWMPYMVNVFMSSVIAGNDHLTICEMIRNYQNATVVEEAKDCSLNNVAMVMVFGIIMILAVMNIGVTALVKYMGRKNIYIGLQLMAGISTICINCGPYWIVNAILFTLAVSGVFNCGFLSTYTVDLFPTYVRAMAVCLTIMVGRGSAVFGINILKRLMDNHCEYVFYLFGGLSCLGGIIGFLLPSDAKVLEQKKLNS